MHLTAICCKQVRYRFFRQFLRKRRTLKPHDYGIPPALLSKGVQVYDGYKFSKQNTHLDISQYMLEKEKVLQPEFAYEVSDTLRLTEGDAQVQLLTNSLYHKQMPPAYVEQFENTAVPESERMWLENRLEIVKHDAYQSILPKEFHHDKPWIVLPREYGVPMDRKTRQMCLIFNDYVRLTSSSGSPKPTLNDVTCQYIRPSENPYIFRGVACSGTLSSKPLSLVGDPSVTGSLPSMYPAAPEMDLKKTYDYDPRTTYPIVSSVKDYHLHTMYVNHPYVDGWNSKERSGLALLQTFAFAAARAATAQRPLVLQTVYHTLEHVEFVVFQLNTLQSSSDIESDTRNEIWHMSVPLREAQGEGQVINSAAMKWLKVFYAQ